MNCPKCDAPHIIITRTEIHPDGDRRRRHCPACRFTFWTVERIESEDNTQAWQAYLFSKIKEQNGAQALAQIILHRRPHHEP